MAICTHTPTYVHMPQWGLTYIHTCQPTSTCHSGDWPISTHANLRPHATVGTDLYPHMPTYVHTPQWGPTWPISTHANLCPHATVGTDLYPHMPTYVHMPHHIPWTVHLWCHICSGPTHSKLYFPAAGRFVQFWIARQVGVQKLPAAAAVCSHFLKSLPHLLRRYVSLVCC